MKKEPFLLNIHEIKRAYLKFTGVSSENPYFKKQWRFFKKLLIREFHTRNYQKLVEIVKSKRNLL